MCDYGRLQIRNCVTVTRCRRDVSSAVVGQNRNACRCVAIPSWSHLGFALTVIKYNVKSKPSGERLELFTSMSRFQARVHSDSQVERPRSVAAKKNLAYHAWENGYQQPTGRSGLSTLAS